MLTEPAIVTRSDGNMLEVTLERQSACGDCELAGGCGTGALGRLLGKRNKPLRVAGDERFKAGDRVLLGLPESTLVKASLLVYGLPLLGLVIGGLAAQVLFEPAEWLVAALAAIGFYAGFRIAGQISRRLVQEVILPFVADIEVNPGSKSGS